MLGPAGAICVVSPPPSRHPEKPPLSALAAGDITPRDQGDWQCGGAGLAPICFSDALGWAIWRGLQRLIPERL